MTAAILIIEDSIDDQRLYQRALKNCDYSLTMVPTAEIALVRLPDLKPDLIMLDYKLPDLDGLSFLKKLAEYSHAAIPILMLTGEGSEAVAVEAMKNGADDYLVKDTGGGYLRLLPGTIERVLNAHEQRVQTQRLQALHKRVIDTSIDGFWMTDLSGNLLEANESYARISGYSVEELMSMHISQLEAMEQSAEEVQTHIAKIIAQGHDRFETRHRHKNGHEIDIEVSVTYMAESQRLCVFCRDITESKRAEEILRKSENRFRTLVENAPLCIHEIGRDGRLTSMNRAGLLMMGARDECEVQGFLYLDAVNAADRERVGGLLARAYDGEVSHFEFKSAGQRERIFKSCFVPIMNSEGNIEKLMGITEDITEHKAAEEQIRSLAFYDALTHLPNRRLLDDRLGQAMTASKRSGRYGALMFLDMDNFKPLNDQYGHLAGDLLLVEAAQRISSCVRETDTVARFGGDEFMVMLGELEVDQTESAAKSGIVAEKIRTILAEPYALTFQQEGKEKMTIEHRCTSSIGVALFINHEAETEDIVKYADLAMYQAKKDGRNSIRFFEPQMLSC